MDIISYCNRVFEDTNLKWVSGYWLPDDISTQEYYVAQFARKTDDVKTSKPITNSNLVAWLERDEDGRKVEKLAKARKYKLVMSPVPHQPGYVHLMVYIPYDREKHLWPCRD